MLQFYHAFRKYHHCLRAAFWLCLGMLLLAPPLAAQTNKASLVRVKTERETRKKQRETSGFKGQRVKGGDPVQKTQKNVTSFKGERVRGGQQKVNVSDMSKAAVYNTPAEAPARSRNKLGAQMLRQSERANGRGGLVYSQYYKQKIAKRKSKKLSSYRGDLRVVDRKKAYRKKSNQLSSYKGDILVRKKPKGAFPGSAYKGGYANSSFKKKEKYRKKMLKKLGRSKKQMVPNYKKRKDEKPTYDTRESEIWDKPR
ncbi:MAG TPA: hypothetical protein VF646_17375 [Cytophagales bacterium]|jgi:hypothetical protein